MTLFLFMQTAIVLNDSSLHGFYTLRKFYLAFRITPREVLDCANRFADFASGSIVKDEDTGSTMNAS